MNEHTAWCVDQRRISLLMNRKKKLWCVDTKHKNSTTEKFNLLPNGLYARIVYNVYAVGWGNLICNKLKEFSCSIKKIILCLFEGGMRCTITTTENIVRIIKGCVYIAHICARRQKITQWGQSCVIFLCVF